MNDHDLLAELLERLAREEINLPASVYGAFYQHYPATAALFGSDPGDKVKYTMINNILLALTHLARNQLPEYDVQRWANDHIGYGATLDMFPALLNHIENTIGASLQEQFTAQHQAAWRRQCQRLLAMITPAYIAAQKTPQS